MDTHEAILKFGRYDGVLLTRVPYSYLVWGVANNCTGDVMLSDGRTVPFHEAAKVEIERRGERMVDIEISRHAINRASLRLIDVWRKEHRPDEGLYSWLERWAQFALDNATPNEWHGKFDVLIDSTHVIFVLDTSVAIPILKTVFLKRI